MLTAVPRCLLTAAQLYLSASVLLRVLTAALLHPLTAELPHLPMAVLLHRLTAELPHLPTAVLPHRQSDIPLCLLLLQHQCDFQTAHHLLPAAAW